MDGQIDKLSTFITKFLLAGVPVSLLIVALELVKYTSPQKILTVLTGKHISFLYFFSFFHLHLSLSYWLWVKDFFFLLYNCFSTFIHFSTILQVLQPLNTLLFKPLLTDKLCFNLVCLFLSVLLVRNVMMVYMLFNNFRKLHSFLIGLAFTLNPRRTH